VPSYRHTTPTEQLHALWRQKWLLAGVAVAVAVLIAVWATRTTQWSSTASIALVDESPSAASVGFGGLQLKPSATGEVVYLDSLADEIEARTGDDVNLSAAGLDGAQRIDVTMSADGSDVDAQLGALITEFLERRRQQRAELLAAGLAVRDERIAATERDLTTVTESIETAPDGVSEDVLQIQRIDILQELTRLRSESAGIRELADRTTGGVRVASPPSEPKQSAPNSIKIPSAVIVGLFVALGVGLVRNRFDRRIYSVSDVAFVAPGVEVLGVASASGSMAGADLAGRAVRRRAQHVGARRVLLVPVSSVSAANVVADAVRRDAAQDAASVEVLPPVQSSQQAFTVAAEGDHVVLLVAVGTDTSTEVQRALRQFGMIGAAILGVVLSDVADGEEAHAYESSAALRDVAV
jgi:hypothetical protein